MNKLLLILSLISISYAINQSCFLEERIPTECPQEYLPVCGVIVSKQSNFSQSKKTFNNKCLACQDGSIDFVAEGSCDEYPNTATFCHPDAHHHKGCTKDYFPVCGQFDNNHRCVRSPCGQNYSNKCYACGNRQVSFFIPGHCEEQQYQHVSL